MTAAAVAHTTKLKKYLDKEGIQGILEELMQSLMHSQPTDPINHMIRLLQRKAEQRGITTVLETSSQRSGAEKPIKSERKHSLSRKPQGHEDRPPSAASRDRGTPVITQVQGPNQMFLAVDKVEKPFSPRASTVASQQIVVVTSGSQPVDESDELANEFPSLGPIAVTEKPETSGPQTVTVEELLKMRQSEASSKDKNKSVNHRHKELEEMILKKKEDDEARKKITPVFGKDEESETDSGFHSPEDVELLLAEGVSLPSHVLDAYREQKKNQPVQSSPTTNVIPAEGNGGACVSITLCANCAKLCVTLCDSCRVIIGGAGFPLGPPSLRSGQATPKLLSHHSSRVSGKHEASVILTELEAAAYDDIESASQVSGPRPMPTVAHVQESMPRTGSRPPSNAATPTPSAAIRSQKVASASHSRAGSNKEASVRSSHSKNPANDPVPTAWAVPTSPDPSLLEFERRSHSKK